MNNIVRLLVVQQLKALLHHVCLVYSYCSNIGHAPELQGVNSKHSELKIKSSLINFDLALCQVQAVLF